MDEVLQRLEHLIRTGTIFAVLRRCHLPCRRLVSFEDFCQEVFLRAVRHQRSFRGQSDQEMAGWLRAIGNQNMVEHLRRSRQERLLPLRIDIAQPEAPRNAERLAWLMQVLSRLPVEDRDLLLRRYWHRESWQEIGRELNVAPNTLTQRHLRLLQRLRSMDNAEFSSE